MPFTNRKVKRHLSTQNQLRLIVNQMRELYREVEVVQAWTDNPRKKKWLALSVKNSQDAVVTLINAIEQR